MKLLGIDYGTVRIGLAISDESGMLARELSILSPKEFFSGIADLIYQYEVEEIVVGLPMNMSGEDSAKTTEVRAFAQQLSDSLKIPVHLFDERLSSVMASNSPGGDKNVDSLAAQIILQNYLNKNK